MLIRFLIGVAAGAVLLHVVTLLLDHTADDPLLDRIATNVVESWMLTIIVALGCGILALFARRPKNEER